MLRAEACFRHFGFETERAGVPTPESLPDNVSVLYMSVRETAALAYYWARGRFADAPSALAMPHADAPDPQLVLASAAQPPGPSGLRNPAGPIVILGASYAKGWSLQLPGQRVVNKGVAGQETVDLQARFQGDVVAQQPRAVIIWGFINDIFRAPRDQVDARRQRAMEQTAAMVEAARAAGIEPVLATEVTIRGKSETWSDTFSEWAGWLLGKTSYQAFINGHVVEGNARLRDYAKREGLLLLDLQPVLAQADGQRKAEFARADGSHITAAGYEALSRYAQPILERHFAGR
jgi:lysophospholipase L1-like esterase